MLGVAADEGSYVSCNHNHVRRETHGGEALWVHRKGAISAATGEPGLIPGSMGTHSFHVEGRGCAAALSSSAHGAGRRMSRTDARRTVSAKDVARELRGVWFDHRLAAGLREEAPSAYKDIDARPARPARARSHRPPAAAGAVLQGGVTMRRAMRTRIPGVPKLDPPPAAEERITTRHSDGSKAMAEYLIDGKRVGTRSFDRAGNIEMECGWRDGLRHGTEYRFDEPGKLLSATPYSNGVGAGVAREWADDGRLLRHLSHAPRHWDRAVVGRDLDQAPQAISRRGLLHASRATPRLRMVAR